MVNGYHYLPKPCVNLYLSFVPDTMYMQSPCDTDDGFDAVCFSIWKSLPGESLQYTRIRALLLVSTIIFVILVNSWNFVSCESTDPLSKSDALCKSSLLLRRYLATELFGVKIRL